MENFDTFSSRAYCVILALICLAVGVILFTHAKSNVFFLIMNILFIIFGIFVLYSGIRPGKTYAMKIAKYAGQGDPLLLIPITVLSLFIGKLLAEVWGKR